VLTLFLILIRYLLESKNNYIPLIEKNFFSNATLIRVSKQSECAYHKIPVSDDLALILITSRRRS
jgi:hypothetical protein